MTNDDIVDRLRIATMPTVQCVKHEAADEIERLRKERDEARRMVCRHNYIRGGINPLQYAKMMNWDCYDKTPYDTDGYAPRGR